MLRKAHSTGIKLGEKTTFDLASSYGLHQGVGIRVSREQLIWPVPEFSFPNVEHNIASNQTP